MINIQELLARITDPGMTLAFFPWSILFGVVGIGMLVFIVWVIWKFSWKQFVFLFDFTEFFTYRAYGTGGLTGKWKNVVKRLETASEEEYKLAVLEADGMLDQALKRMNFAGDTLTDRLQKVSTGIIANLSEVRQANAIRNNIVHDPNYRLTLSEARRIIEIYEAAFMGLDLLS
ncbi:MAG: hypothetical protein HYU04_02150 [Candidatus Wildermuthbacteria bacterium]|nr:hypothetical protein [Candidatus Wildermuthbacteria bacterium]